MDAKITSRKEAIKTLERFFGLPVSTLRSENGKNVILVGKGLPFGNVGYSSAEVKSIATALMYWKAFKNGKEKK